jgi:predicted porin
MEKKSFLRAALFAALFTVLAVGVSAQVTISGGFALSTMSAEVGDESVSGDIGFGGNIYADYLLPISVPLSLGLEVGYDTASISYTYGITGYAIPILARAAYHFDFMANLDLYLVGKIGYVLGGGEMDDESESGFKGIGFGFDVGAAYYFVPRFGAFIEAGFDRYNIKKDIDDITVKIPFTRFVTIGVSTKF